MYLELFSDRYIMISPQIAIESCRFRNKLRRSIYVCSRADRRCFATTLSKKRRPIEPGLKRMPGSPTACAAHSVEDWKREIEARARCNRERESSIRSSAKIASDKASTRERERIFPSAPRASTIVEIVAISGGSFSVKRVLKYRCARNHDTPRTRRQTRSLRLPAREIILREYMTRTWQR